MHTRSIRRSVMLGVLLLGFGGAWLTGACDAGTQLPPRVTLPDTSTGTPDECPDTIEDPCNRWYIPLLGNPKDDLALRNKYIAAFGSPCYMSVNDTFDCFYQQKELKTKACNDAKQIAEVFGAAPYDKSYECEPIPNTDDFRLQVGPDVSNEIIIRFKDAPRQTPLVVVDGVPTEVNGPYRNLVDPAGVAPGNKFDYDSGMLDADGFSLDQRKWVLEVNRKKNGGKIRSDLAGFTWTCKGADGGVTICEELDELVDPDPMKPKPPFYLPGEIAEVHHVVPRKDKRCCPWGTNAYTNAAVISRELNNYFRNNDPPEEEVKRLNNASAYTP